MSHFSVIARLLRLLSIFGAIFVLLQPSLTLAAVTIGAETVDLGPVVFRSPAEITWWKAILSFLPNAIVAWGLVQLSLFGKHLTLGGRFTKAVSDSLRKASFLFVIGVVISWLVEPVISNQSLVGAFVQLLENHGLLLLISLAFTLVATLLNEARDIEAENKEFY
ncbi:hypothetical protein KFE96_09560 [Kordiimonas sp. SCSIO 12603]|uniref:hypothetical protein n=1 Tax=Kordiimonas sp. SCSIO 12603 TaxID=2829596 RepID=UPI002105C77D|nr:hypothetical protein [Kordiimonas sp. SCSIO 12603]UTW57113.1 hypothetical protein KFE96_09560 [Kordiimonas sp. SCSIO 12603]